MKPTCTARTPGEAPCGAAPLRGSTLCFFHHPDYAAEATEARRLGGLRRRREGTIIGAFDLEPLDTVAGVRRILEVAVNDTTSLENGIARNRTLLAAGRVLAELLRDTELEVRIEALERALVRRPPVHQPPGADDVDGEA